MAGIRHACPKCGSSVRDLLDVLRPTTSPRSAVTYLDGAKLQPAEEQIRKLRNPS